MRGDRSVQRLHGADRIDQYPFHPVEYLETGFAVSDRGFDSETIDEYNRQTRFEFERSRDFLILHYKANQREEAFWQRCSEMSVPDTLAHKIELFRRSARIFRENEELFTEVAWLQVMIGQGIVPERYHPMVDMLSQAEIEQMVEGTRAVLDRAAAAMPSHADFIARVLAGSTPG